MKTIFACGTDRKTKSELLDHFLKKHSVILQKNTLFVTGNSHLLHLTARPPRRTNVEKGVLLFFSEPPETTELSISNRLIGLCESNNKPALSCLMKNGNPVVTYGLAPTDTVTVSSFLDDKTQIALQREIKTVSGQIVEPFEFSLDNEGYSQTTRLIIGALHILFGE